MSKIISIEKTKFRHGETIKVSYENATIGTYPDWIAIFAEGVDFSTGSTHSVQYAYVNGSGTVIFNDNNNATDDRESVDSETDATYSDLTKVYYNTTESTLPCLPIGKYYAIMLADGGYSQASENIVEFAVEGLQEKMTNIADAIRTKTRLTDKLTLDDMATQAGREWVTGLFKNLPIERNAVQAICQTLEGVVNTALNLGGGGDLRADIEKYTYIYLSRKYDWVIEPADALVGGDPVSDFIDYYWVRGDFTVTCKGIKAPRIYLDRAMTRIDEYGEFRPPIIATIYGCKNYADWVGICDATASDYTYASVHDHWGYVQLGGDNIGSVYDQLNADLIPPDESKVVISRGNLCRSADTVLSKGDYKLVLFANDIYGNQTGYEALAEATFTLV